MKNVGYKNQKVPFKPSCGANFLLCQCLLISVPKTCGRESSGGGQSCDGGRPQWRRREDEQMVRNSQGLFQESSAFTAHILT